LKAYNKLPDEWKRLFMDSRKVAYDALVAGYAAADKKWIPIYEANPNLKEIRFKAEDLAEVERIGGKPVWNEWVEARKKEGLPGQEMLDTVLNAANAAK
jgi:hypothetical protein